MFNYECYKRKGTVLGTCIDGFLFGACCLLPDESAAGESSTKPAEPPAAITLVNNFVVSSVRPAGGEATTLPSSPGESTTLLSSLPSLGESTTPPPSHPSQLSDTVSLFISKLSVPETFTPPSIILANGSIVSLESLAHRPDLLKQVLGLVRRLVGWLLG